MVPLRNLLCLLALASTLALARAAEPLRVFIRGGPKTHGPNQHDHPRFLREWTQLLAQRGLRVDGGLEFPPDAQLRQTDVLILYAADGMKITGNQRASFESFLGRGGGVVVVHDGVVSGDEHAWCKEILGGAWRWDLPKENQTKWYEGEVGICWIDLEHPISRGISNFDWKDEIYYDLDTAPDIGVLAASFQNVHVIAPQIWTYEKTRSGGAAPYRAFVSLPGHEYDVFETPHYRAILLRGIAWAGKRSDVDEFVRPEELASLRYPAGGPLPAVEAAKTLRLHPEFNLSLAADEKLAEKIMSLDWDARGRLWVVETPEYPGGREVHRNDFRISPWRVRDPERFPAGSQESRPARDRVSILEDTDGDGVMDRKSVFADGLELPTSLVFYRDGVIVTQAPEILWLRDRDGDGRADERTVLFAGWGTADTHAVTSNLRWGPDGWIYGSVGYSSGEPRSVDGGRRFGRITAGLYRFRPDGSALEQVAAGSCNTWGCEIAPDGEIFFSTATCGEPILHLVLPEQVVGRAGLRGVRAARPIIEENKVFPARIETRQPYLQIDWVGAWTAASGACIYDGGAWPGKWQGPAWSFFLHEPTVWLMHHEFLEPSGVSYQGRRERGREQTHFLAGTDYWFKPIHSRVGPDGALYLVDFYNQIAVHNDTRGPAHGAHNAATRPDRDHHFTRLWRIQHKQAQALPPFRLDSKNPGALIEMLDHPNGWVRVTANRLLSEGAGRDVLPALRRAAGSARTIYGRMQAMWVLHNLGADDPGILLAAAQDPDPVLRKNAMRIVAERGGAAVEVPLALLGDRLTDANARVRLNALVAAGTFPPSRELAELVVRAWPTLDDRQLEAAALAVTVQDPLLYLRAGFAVQDPGPVISLARQLARQVAERNDAAMAHAFVVDLAAQPAAVDGMKAAALQSFTASLAVRVQPAADDALVNAVRQLLGAEQTAGAVLPLVARWEMTGAVGNDAKRAVGQAAARLADASIPDDIRGQMAVNLLGVRTLDPSLLTSVAGLVGGNSSAGLQRVVIEALGATDDPAAGQALLTALPKLNFDLREAVIGQLLKRVDWSAALVRALADRSLDPGLLGLANLARFRTHADPGVAREAAKVIDELRGPEQKEKETLIASLRAEVVRPGNTAGGAKVFTQNCAPCHKFKEEGADFAPNLTGMGAHGAEDLLTHIVDPNRVVEPNFVSASIETKDDLIYDGIVLRENNEIVVLRNQTAETEIRKDNILSRRATGRSLMPEGFEQLGVEALRDLLTYLCADEQRYRILDLSGAFTANTSRGIYTTPQSRDESLRFRKWGTIRHRDVPFDIINPLRTATGNNVIVLQGGAAMSRNYPKQVEVRVGLPVRTLHFLGGIGAWAHPLGRKDQPAAKVIVHFAGGGTEEIVLRNGVEIADYIARIDVPGSEALENLDDLLQQGRQVRYFAKPLTRPGRVEKLTVSSEVTEVAPTFVAITAELAEGGAVAATRPAAGQAGGAADSPGQIRVLLVGAGSSHDFPRWFLQEDGQLFESTGRARVLTTGEPDEVLKHIDQLDVLYLSNNAPYTNAAARKAVMDFARSGKGVLLVHAGLWYNWKDWPEYNRDLAGGGSRGHDRLGEFEVKVTEPDHPLVKGLPASFRITDELYWFEPDSEGPPIRVLATAHSAQKDRIYPMIFVVEHARARIAGITLGHDGAAHTHPAYRQLLQNALDWAARR